MWCGELWCGEWYGTQVWFQESLGLSVSEIDAEECGVSEQQLTVCLSTLRKVCVLT